MIKLLEAYYLGHYQIHLAFSDGQDGIFDVKAYLAMRTGSLLNPLHNEVYVKRFFIDAGALCWPNGLELSPARLYEISLLKMAA